MSSDLADLLHVLSALTENPKRGLFFLNTFQQGLDQLGIIATGTIIHQIRVEMSRFADDCLTDTLWACGRFSPIWIPALAPSDAFSTHRIRNKFMSYRNKTYVIFDGDNDMWAYAYMKGWKSNQNVDFNFHDAHDLNTITNLSGEENTKRKLRERLVNTKQAIVLIGDSTKDLYRFVRWEIDICQDKGLPIVAVNLNNKRQCDTTSGPKTSVGPHQRPSNALVLSVFHRARRS